jgi:cobalt/nickel transport system permease protein
MKTLTIPEWYNAGLEPAPEKTVKVRAAKSYFRKALADMAGTFGRINTASSTRQSRCSRIDARVKVFVYISLIAAVVSAHAIWQLLLLLGLALLLIASTRTGWKGLAVLWLGVPIFSLAISLPAVLNIVTPGSAVLAIMPVDSHLGPWTFTGGLSITSRGLLVAGRFVARTLCCVTFSYILLSITRPEILIGALRSLGMPKIFGMILAMTHRYIMALLAAAEDLHRAGTSRTICAVTVKGAQRWAASGITTLLRKSLHLSQEVHQAMISRGFDGDLKVAPPAPLKAADYVLMALTLIFVISLLLLERGGGI